MAWNEPGQNDKDPWSNQNNNRPPDLDRALKSLLNKISRSLGGGSSTPKKNKSLIPPGSAWLGILIVALITYVSSAVYMVDEKELAVILRFGSYHETVGPGLHIYFPPIDHKAQERVTELRTYNLRQQMLTEDENIVEVALSVQYNISDIKDFALNAVEPIRSLEEATQSALRHVVGSSKMYQVLTAGRENMGIKVRERLQDYINSYGVGLHISKINVESAHPPKEVQAAFDDVIRAREDEEREKNIAKVYANKIIPESRGKAQRMLEDALGYKEEIISRATGEANRFLQLAEEYAYAPEVTRDRLYLEAIEEIYSNTSKVLINTENSNNLMYLPLDKLNEVKKNTNSATTVDQLSNKQIQDIANKVVDEINYKKNTSNQVGRSAR